ncbi:MAG TPA: SGNH/GDSL hydrolase family protein [Terriglobales bacterium]|nr:SGNH/GDSL hydrolase family protein [Terriglobales bacterium]
MKLKRNIQLVFIFLLCTHCVTSAVAQKSSSGFSEDARWVGTWASSPYLAIAENVPPPPGLTDSTLRQVIRASVGGARIRVRLSNAVGRTPLVVKAAHVALSAGGGAITPQSDKPLTFNGKGSAVIPAGALLISDSLDFRLAPLTDVAITLAFGEVPEAVTSHPGSRTTSYLQKGETVDAAAMPDGVKADRWYVINGVDVLDAGACCAVVALGDSITDGRGSTTNGNDRWTDQLARRLQGDKKTRNVGVLNHGIGGNRLLHDGLGPNALARFDRDVLAQTAVRWLIILEGVNDLGTRIRARERKESWATADDIIAAYEQMITRAHAKGIRVYGATILPFGGSFYFAPDIEADRQTINKWIRTSGKFDAVIDFDAALRDPKDPARLLPTADTGDHLHPNALGYKMMGDAIDLRLFR